MSIGDLIRLSSLESRNTAILIDMLGPIAGGSSTGAANAYTIAPIVAPTRLVNTQRFTFFANHTNTGAATLAIADPVTGATTIAAKDIKNQAGAALVAGDIQANRLATVIYYISVDDFYLVNGGTNLQEELNAAAAINTFSPVAITGNGAMTVTADSTIQFRYYDLGPFRYFTLGVGFTIGGTPNTTVSLSVPAAGTAMAAGMELACAATDGDGTGIPDARWYFTGAQIDVFKAGLANWTAGANGKIFIDGKHQR